MSECRRITMWSGPRNVSTAMMYAWRQRSDTTVWDDEVVVLWPLQQTLSHTTTGPPSETAILPHRLMETFVYHWSIPTT